MSALSDLSNVGSVLHNNLLRIGVETPEQLRNIGAEEAFVRIRMQADPGACLHMLYGIQGAIDGTPYKFLSIKEKERLKTFYYKLINV